MKKEGKEKGEAFFDEARFLRRVRWRSTVRSVLISLVVLVTVLSLFYIGTRYLLDLQDNRIGLYYPELVRYSTPNTVAIAGPWRDEGWLGRQKEYLLVRMVGDRPVYVGTATVEFQIWGGELIWDPDYTVVKAAGGKDYFLPGMVPVLKFFHPAVKHEQLPREFDRLDSIPAGDTVEMALSFDRLLTKQEMEALLPAGVVPLWGAVAAYSNEEIAAASQKDPGLGSYLAHRLVGIPFNGERQLTEAQFIEELRRLSEVPSYSSAKLKRIADYLQQNGIRYYGLVVTGKPGDLGKLRQNPAITAAMIGGVTGRQ
ncbi:anti sigma factor C-terminal domain-containing protein [Neomoorella carbonis]|uniref:anti sigma factor C-terminal domain-containing protein n=1 Tax=Neomoorella carbonis TaxID=3062783 RepID=UPI003245DAE8